MRSVHAKEEVRRQNEEGKIDRSAFAGGCYGGQESCHGGRRTVPHGWIEDEEDDWSCVQRPPSQQTATARQGSAKEGDHEVKNAPIWYGCDWEEGSCSGRLNVRREYLIFRELRGFFTIFHRFFTPYFSQKSFNIRDLSKTHGYKRHNNSKCRVQNAKLTTDGHG